MFDVCYDFDMIYVKFKFINIIKFLRHPVNGGQNTYIWLPHVCCRKKTTNVD